MNQHSAILAIVLTVTTLGCVPHVDVESEQAALLETDEEWAAAVAAGNAERILSFWANDATVYFPSA